MASRSTHRQNYLPSEDLLPVNYHGLDTKDQLTAHAERFRRTKQEIAQGKRRRRNSISDCRTRATVEADGPDGRFEDVAIAESGIRDGLSAVTFMPSYPNVQSFTRRSARWDDLDQDFVSEDDELDKLEDSSSQGSTYDGNDFSPTGRRTAKTSRQTKPVKVKSTSSKTALGTKRMSAKASTSDTPTTSSIFYKCYAKNCKYEHARRGNFSIHWKRDAKHPGTFDLKKVLQCSRHQAGSTTTIPYGKVNTHRRRESLGTMYDASIKETSKRALRSNTQATAPQSKKRKPPTEEEPQKATRTRSTAAPIANDEIFHQESDATTGECPAKPTQASNPLVYSSLERQIFKRFEDVPANFPAHLAPLITHGGPDSESPNTATSDCRYFCPECQKCFTQTHNVASHFSRAHGKKYSKNDRDRTVCCRVNVSQNRVNVDAKPIDETILPRLEQIRRERGQALPAATEIVIPVDNADIYVQKDDTLNLETAYEAEPAELLIRISEMVHTRVATSSNPHLTSQGVSQRALTPQQSSEHIRRMQAVRDAILGRMTAPTLSAANGLERQPGDSQAAAATSGQISATGADRYERDEGRRAARKAVAVDTSVIRQPSWQDISQPIYELKHLKRKRTASISSDKYGEELPHEAAEKQRGTGDIVSFEATPVQTRTATNAQTGFNMAPKESSIAPTQPGRKSEKRDRSSRPDEQKGIADVKKAPAKRRKMTFAEYSALQRGVSGALALP